MKLWQQNDSWIYDGDRSGFNDNDNDLNLARFRKEMEGSYDDIIDIEDNTEDIKKPEIKENKKKNGNK